MEYVTVLQTNPFTFIAEVVEAIEQGYLVESSNRGWVSDSILKQITLYKDDDRTIQQRDLGEFVISDYSAQNFLYELYSWVTVGAKVDIDSLFWDITGIKSIRGKLYLPAEYTKEQLSELDWTEFKEAVKPVVGTGRDRALLLTRYLQSTGQIV